MCHGSAPKGRSLRKERKVRSNTGANADDCQTKGLREERSSNLKTMKTKATKVIVENLPGRERVMAADGGDFVAISPTSL